MDSMSYSDIRRLEPYIEDLYPEGITDTGLNDFLWFERELIADLLGYRNFEALANQDEESWEDHARSFISKTFPNADEDIIENYLHDKFMDEMSDDEIYHQFDEYNQEKEEEE